MTPVPVHQTRWRGPTFGGGLRCVADKLLYVIIAGRGPRAWIALSICVLAVIGGSGLIVRHSIARHELARNVAAWERQAARDRAVLAEARAVRLPTGFQRARTFDHSSSGCSQSTGPGNLSLGCWTSTQPPTAAFASLAHVYAAAGFSESRRRCDTVRGHFCRATFTSSRGTGAVIFIVEAPHTGGATPTSPTWSGVRPGSEVTGGLAPYFLAQQK